MKITISKRKIKGGTMLQSQTIFQIGKGACLITVQNSGPKPLYIVLK